MEAFFKSFSGVFSISWAGILAAVIYWLGGINSFSGGGIKGDIVNLTLLLLFLYFLYQYHSPKFCTKITLDKKSLISFSLLTIILLLLSWGHLIQPLWGDQIYHANLASRQGQLIIFLMEKGSPNLWAWVKEWPAAMIVWSVNGFIVSLLGIFFIYLPRALKHSKKALMVVGAIFFIVSHYAIISSKGIFGGLSEPVFLLHYDWDPHPTLRLLPLLISSTFFGTLALGYRAAGFVGYLLLLAFMFSRLRVRTSSLVAFLAVFAVATLPIFWHVAYLAEQSIWSTVAAAAIFIWIFSCEKLEEIPLIPIASLVLISLLMRTPALISIAPLFVLTVYMLIKRRVPRNERTALILLYVLIALGLFVLISRGSPATEQISGLDKWILAFSNNIPAIAGASVLGLFPIFFIGFIFILRNQEDIVRLFLSMIFFALACAVFYIPVTTSLWGVARYQSEIFVPLVVAGVTAFCVNQFNEEFKLKSANLRDISLAASPLLFLIVANLFSLSVFDQRSFMPFPNGPTPGGAIKTEVEYPMKAAFKFIRLNKLQKNTFYIGIYYSGYISSLMGMSASDYLAFSRLNSQYRDGFSVNASAINADQKIESVIIEPEADSGAIKALTDFGWKGRYEFSQKRSVHKLIILTREAIK